MSTNDTTIGGESAAPAAEFVPLIPNTVPKAIGDIVGAHDAFTRKFSTFGEIVAIDGDVLTIKCPCCDHEVCKHWALVAQLAR